MDAMIYRAAAIEALSTPCDKRYRHGVWETCLDNIETAIRNIPAVDAGPVIHARWQGLSPFVDSGECSHCRYSIPSDEFETPYCPLCGAKMDGERRDSE